MAKLSRLHSALGSSGNLCPSQGPVDMNRNSKRSVERLELLATKQLATCFAYQAQPLLMLAL